MQSDASVEEMDEDEADRLASESLAKNDEEGDS
jgi:hypothetical protein